LKPLYIGFLLAIVMLAAGFLLPVLLPRSTTPTTVQALQEAELARRQLHSYDAMLPLAGMSADVTELKEADFERLLERARTQFDALTSEFNKQVSQAKSADRGNRMPETDLRAASMTPSGVRSSVGGLETSLSQNQRLLSEAAKNTRAALQTDRNALGVGQVGGAVKLVEAQQLLDEARQLRAQLTSEQSRLLAVAARGAEVRGERDRRVGLAVVEIQNILDGDLEEIEAALDDAQAEVDRLSAEVAEREQALAAVRSQLEEARRQRLDLEEAGFAVGDDASFEAYRTEYLRLSEMLRQHEARGQLLAYGGVEGGRVVGDDLMTGEIEGGETIVGLNELKRNLTLAEDKLTRYTQARQALEDRKGLVTTMGAEARAWESQYTTRLDALVAEVQQIRAAMEGLAQQAFEKEESARAAARDAAAAFGSAKAAASRWTGDASALQRERDPQRLNERLKRIASDKLAGEAAESGEAQAKMLEGRILTERALGLGDYLDALARANELLPTGELDLTALQESFTQARDQAISTLSDARAGYERLAQSQSNTSWVHQASLATVYHLLWLIDDFNAAQHRSNLLDQLGRVIENRRQSPYLQQQVALHALLTAGVEAPQRKQPTSSATVEPDADEGGGESGGD
jgi:chromosome segregation ATPase